MRTKSEIRSNVCTTTREVQLNSANGLVDEYINQTLHEINDPAWAFEAIGMRGYSHLWSFNKRKDTLYASGEFSQLPRDLDKISLIRQIESPVKLRYIPDDLFYRFIPNPTATGNPLYYRLWEEEGVSTRLTADDTINVVSNSTSDITQTVSVVGYDTIGIIQSEVYTLNGTTAQSGSKTFDSGRPIRVSKSGSTAGKITLSENTSGTTLVVLGAEERSPRFKVIGIYPILESLTGTISAFANYGATVTGTVKVTDTAHGLASNQSVTIAGTTNYNGTYLITKIDADTFYITATWVATETGTWTRVIPLYLEYYTRIRRLVNEADVPDLDEKWIWIVRLGTLAKVYQYQKEENLFPATQLLYAGAVRSMVKSDIMNEDYIPTLNTHRHKTGMVELADDSFSLTY